MRQTTEVSFALQMSVTDSRLDSINREHFSHCSKMLPKEYFHFRIKKVRICFIILLYINHN